jgi:tripartite ATP-independent transporter DctP family solute receptor
MREISRRSLLKSSIAVGLAAGLAAPSIARAGDQISLRISSGMPMDPTAAHYGWFQQFEINIKEAFGDRIKLLYFPNNQLGSEADVVQQVKVGAVDMMVTGSSIWATVAAEIGLLDLGFMFDSFDHVAAAIDGGAGATLAEVVKERTNATILGWGFNFGARNVYTKFPITSIADLHERKLRVLPTPVFIETFKALGAVPTPIPVNELYTSLQTGVVDGFEHDAGTVLAQKFYEVANHGFLTQHLFGPMLAAIGRNGLRKIPEDIQETFLKCASDAMLVQRKIALERSQQAMEELGKRGVVYSPLPAEERMVIQKDMNGKLYVPFTDKYPKAKPIMDIINATRKA